MLNQKLLVSISEALNQFKASRGRGWVHNGVRVEEEAWGKARIYMYRREWLP